MTSATPSPANPFQIIVAGFRVEDGAKVALQQLQAAGISQGNIAVIARDDENKLHISETQDWGVKKSAVVGGIAGLLLPGIGTIAGAAAGAIFAKLHDAGFPDEALRQLGSQLHPESSAIVALLQQSDQARAEQILTAAGGTLVSGSIAPDLAEELERAATDGK